MKYIQLFQQAQGLAADGIIEKNTLLQIKDYYKIPTIEGLAHFIANTHHESCAF